MEIFYFSDLRNYLQNFVCIRGNLTFIFSCEPSVNRPFGPSSNSKRLLRLLSINNELSGVFTAKARLLRSDRAWLELGRNVATERDGCLVAMLRSDLFRAPVRCLVFPPQSFSSKTFAFNMSSSHGDKRSSDVEMGEATSPAPIPTSPVEAPACVADHLSFRERLVRRQVEKELVRAGTEFPSSSALAIAPGHRTEVVTLQDAETLMGSGVPDASALPAGLSMTPILVEDKERAADSMPPPPARKEIVLALRAPSSVPFAQPKGRKRKFTKGGDRESSQQGGSSIASGLRGKFMSLIDGMISECGSETSRLAGELSEFQGRWSETEAMLTAVKDSHSAKVSKLEVAIGELEKDLGKTVSSLLKEKKAGKAKSSEVRRLQHQIEGDAGLAIRGIREATDALRYEFQARLAKISAFLGSLECIWSRDLALATIEGRMAVVQSGRRGPTVQLQGRFAVVDGDFNLILADLKSACFLPTCSEDPEGKDPVVGENGGDATTGLDEATGEKGALKWSYFMFRDWPYVALNPCRSAAFFL
ncbi:hypothetical protein IGI04_007270 [Brassica rapa subsp. trilocularis]|uniref:LSM domain-containing protein n=1 Tax=Brassica rapa subsp. trilocularis TaxID=1813537 RepID=A0ABQ7NKI0_BRACM|nr:hypothetical protein IGI04_007270 [Brassica rapa subsp. trilocularis]